MTDPSAGLAPIRQAGLDNINRAYMGISSRLGSQFASRGYGSSGDFGSSLYNTEYQRGGAISGLEGQLAQMANSNRQNGASLSEQLLNLTRGSTTTGTGPSTALSDGFQSAGNGLNNISTLLTLSQALKGNNNTNNNSYPTAGTDYNPALLGPSYNFPQPDTSNPAGFIKKF